MSTVGTIVNAAVRQHGITNLSATKLDQCREALNFMLIDWASSPQGVYAVTRESFTLTATDNEYTIGPSQDFDTVKPIRVIRAFLRDSSGLDSPLDVISSKDYAEESLKSESQRPYSLYRECGETSDSLVFYPTPDSAYGFHIWSHKPLGSYSALTDDLSLPDGYEPTIKYNLAVVIAPELAVQPSQVTIELAYKSFKNLTRKNISVPTAVTGRYS